MRFIIASIMVGLLSGCHLLPKSPYEKRKTELKEDIELLRLEVRREKLQIELEELESE